MVHISDERPRGKIAAGYIDPIFSFMGEPLQRELSQYKWHACELASWKYNDIHFINYYFRSGFSPVVTCSPRSFDLVKSLGAIEAFDYQSPTCGIDIQTYTSNSLQYAMDCITNTRSMSTCYAAIGRSGGKYVSLDPFPIRGHARYRRPRYELLGSSRG